MILSIRGIPKTGALTLARTISTTIERFDRDRLPGKVGLRATTCQRTSFVRVSLSGNARALLVTKTIIVVIVFLALLGLHATVVALVSVPLSVLFKVVVFPTFKLTVGVVALNNLTMTIKSIISGTVVFIRVT